MIASVATLTSFAQALDSSNQASARLFSPSEKKWLGVVSAVVFALPIFLTLGATKISSQSSLTSKLESPIAIVPANSTDLSKSNDEFAMAQYFLDKAKNPDLAPDVKEGYLASAKSLLTAGGSVDLITPKESSAGNVQRIAVGKDSQTNLSTQVTSNGQGHKLTIKAGTKDIFIEYPSLLQNSQIYLSLGENRDNAVIFVRNQKVGEGFTLSSTQELASDVQLTWYLLETPVE